MIKKSWQNIYVLLCFSLLTSCASLKFSDKEAATQPLPKLSQINIALVLGGGGAKGLAHVGVLEELEKAGIKPDLIVGCSAGSIVGAMYADGMNIKKMKHVLLKARSADFLKFSFRGFPFSLYSSHRFKNFLSNNLHSSDFNSLKIPFVAVATDLQSGNLAPFSKGQLIPAVMASSAYPGAFFPVNIDNNYYIDGGVSNPVPVSIAKKLGAKFIIAVNISEKLNKRNPNHLLGLLKRSLEISYVNHSTLSAEGADITISMPFQEVGTFNDSMNYYLYHTGINEARKQMPAILRKIKNK